MINKIKNRDEFFLIAIFYFQPKMVLLYFSESAER